MKIRNGFVSNSSSSSFLVVCPKDQFDEAVQKAHPFYQKWVETGFGKTQSFLGKDCVVMCCIMSSESEGDTMADWGTKKLPKGVLNYGDKEEPMFDSREIMANFIRYLEENCKDIIINQESC